MASIVLFATAFVFVVGTAVLWANPNRFTNQIFGLMALIVITQQLSVYQAIKLGEHFDQGHGTDPAAILRVGAAISMFLPWTLWILKESLVTAEGDKMRTFIRSAPWFICGTILASMCFSDLYYVLSTSRLSTSDQHGPNYALLNFAVAAMFLLLIVESWLQMRRQSGIRRIEMQFLVLNFATAALLVITFLVVGHFLETSTPRHLTHFIIIAACASSAWAITYRRIFDVRQVAISLLQRIGVILFIAIGIMNLVWVLDGVLPKPVVVTIGAAVVVSLALWIDRRSKRWLDLQGERHLSEMRRAVIACTRREVNPDKLVDDFEAFLRKECGTLFAALLLDHGEAFEAGKLCVLKGSSAHAALCAGGWSTPESLVRQRPNAGLSELMMHMRNSNLGLMVAAPNGSPSPTLVLALGTKFNEWPYTYPEVERLQNIAELMDNILTRSRLTMQAALQAKMEHLAMMSRGLAHDLNNLITPISSFLVHTGERYAPDSTEHEVHAAARRSVRIMGDYVKEALFFSETLTPRFEQIQLGQIFEEVKALAGRRAMERDVTLRCELVFDGAVTADGILLQRMLANLVGNALDASSNGQTVVLAAAAGRAGWLDLSVTDDGHGIAAENLARIFDPYFTTKKYGDNMRGFGLGLTICQKIAHLHGGNISVKSELGCGTSVTIHLPVLGPK